MRRLYVSESALSEIFWDRLFASSDVAKAKLDAEIIIRETKLIHERFPQDVAGSISFHAVVSLWLISRYFNPSHVFEVGTFIGRSSLAIIAGSARSLERMDTCDYSFDQFSLTENLRSTYPNSTLLNYWPKTSSSVALKQLLEAGSAPDMFFIDGRIAKEDLDLMSRLDRKSTIYILDDFEGTEKGLENALILRRAFPELMLIRPSLRANGRTNIGILLSPSLITISRQQDLPIFMQ